MAVIFCSFYRVCLGKLEVRKINNVYSGTTSLVIGLCAIYIKLRVPCSHPDYDIYQEVVSKHRLHGQFWPHHRSTTSNNHHQQCNKNEKHHQYSSADIFTFFYSKDIKINIYIMKKSKQTNQRKTRNKYISCNIYSK